MQDSNLYQSSTLVIGAGELGMSVLRSIAAIAKPGTLSVLLSPDRAEAPSTLKQKTPTNFALLVSRWSRETWPVCRQLRWPTFFVPMTPWSAAPALWLEAEHNGR